MSFLHPLQQSREWYKFVSQRAVKDSEVLRLVAIYIDAMNNLNRRLVELAGSEQALGNIKVAKDAGASHGFIQMAKEYNEYHGVKMTEQELLEDARRHGLVPITAP